MQSIAPFNNFVCIESTIDTDLSHRLTWALEEVNSFLVQHKIGNPFVLGDPYDQNYLNQLHRTWVKFSLSNPGFVSLLKLKDPTLVGKFRSINKTLHLIEKTFYQRWVSASNGEVNLVDNPGFELSHDQANIQLVFNDLGRMTYNKWVNFDNDLDPVDTNDFEHLPAEIEISLARPCTQSAPPEYVEWCKQLGLSSAPGRYLNLGNIKNLEQRLTDYRHLLARNKNIDMFLAI